MKRKKQYAIVAIGLLFTGMLLAVCYLVEMFGPSGVTIDEGRRLHDKWNRKEIVRKIDDYIDRTGKLPESLSELGFEQKPGIYEHCGNSLCLIRTGWHSPVEYILEYWDLSGDRWQYSSEERKWYDEVYFEFEPPINTDTIRGIYNVYYAPRENMRIEVDSLKSNDDIISILDCDIELKADSSAYLRYYTTDTLQMEGWVTFYPNTLPEYLKEFGTWKYYDGKGNCYRKFWNYKQNGKLIYEADQ